MLFMNALLIAIAIAASVPSQPVQTAKETVIVVVKKPAKVWTCGAARALKNDAVQTVRVCEFK